jgi:hypothetical protein
VEALRRGSAFGLFDTEPSEACGLAAETAYSVALEERTLLELAQSGPALLVRFVLPHRVSKTQGVSRRNRSSPSMQASFFLQRRMPLASPAIVASANDPRSQIVSLGDELEQKACPPSSPSARQRRHPVLARRAEFGRSQEVADAEIRLALSGRGSRAIGFHLGVCALSSGSDYSITLPFSRPSRSAINATELHTGSRSDSAQWT